MCDKLVVFVVICSSVGLCGFGWLGLVMLGGVRLG